MALAVDADGVHIGQADLPLAAVRKMVGPGKIIGVSVFTPEEACRAEAMGADYLGLSPIFMTATKPELVCQIGFEGIGPIRRATNLPLVGIGSMNETNAFEAVRCGLDGVAVVSAICRKKNVRRAAGASARKWTGESTQKEIIPLLDCRGSLKHAVWFKLQNQSPFGASFLEAIVCEFCYYGYKYKCTLK